MTDPYRSTDMAGPFAEFAEEPLAASPASARPGTATSSGVARAAVDGAVRLYGPRFERDPARLYREIRNRYGPVAPILLVGDQPAWLVLGYREVHYVTSNLELFARDPRRWNRWPLVPEDWPLRTFVEYRASVMLLDGEEHRRRSKAVYDVLSAVDPQELRTQCEKIADSLVDRFCGHGEADLIAQYADPIPLLVMIGLFGLDDDESASLAHDMVTIVGGGPDAMSTFARVWKTMHSLVVRKREHPGADAMSRFVTHPALLTDDDIVMDVMVLIGAGQLPTSSWIGNTLRLMLVDDRFSLTLSGGRRSVGEALNEVLWEDTPTQNYLGRFAVRTTELGGQRIEAGDMLVLGLAAANADPQVRQGCSGVPGNNYAHMSFSHGGHRCPYPAQEIAEAMVRAAVEVLLDRLPDVTLAVSEDALVWRTSPMIRGLAALPVEFTPM